MKRCYHVLFVSLCALLAGASAGPSREDWNFTDGSITVTVLDEEGRPAPDVEVRCAMDCYGIPGSRLPDATVHRMRTDVEGTCTFSNLIAVWYLLHAQSGGLGAWGKTGLLAPDDKHVKETLRLGVHYSNRGIVRDPSGAPLPGVEVLLRRSMPAAITDENGRYEVRNVEGDMMFFLKKDGYGCLETRYRPPGQNLDITMPEGALLEATLVDTDGQPVPGARAWYEVLGDEIYYSIRVKTDAQGRFTTVWLPPGEKVILGAWRRVNGERWRAEKEVVLDAGADNTATLQLEPYEEPPTTTISGRVVMAGTEDPVPAQIALGEHKEWVHEADFHTDESGRFVLEQLPLKKYYIAALPDDRTLYAVDGLTAVDLSSGKPVEDLAIELAQGCAIRGKVLSADGVTVPEKQVLYCLSSESGTRRVPGYARTVYSEDDGHFEIPCLPCTGEQFELTVGDARAMVGPLQKGEIQEEVVLRLEDVYLKPDLKAAIRGTLVDLGGEPISGAVVTLTAPHRPETCVTRSDGSFELEFREGGTVQFDVAVRKQLYTGRQVGSTTQKAAIVEGGRLTLRKGVSVDGARLVAVIKPPRTLAGTVADEAGQPLEANVDYYQGTTQGGVRCEKGRFLLTDYEAVEPLLLEFRKEAYQAVVLECGRDFDMGDMHIEVVMRKGPFPEGTPIFLAVTGREAPPEGVAPYSPWGSMRDRVRLWKRDAEHVAVVARAEYSIRVTDAQGNPINRIRVEDAVPYGRMGPISRETATVDTDSPSEMLEGEDGRFTLKEKSWRMPWKLSVWISARGTGRELFSAENLTSEEPVHITLHPASKITIRVQDYGGEPIVGLVVGPGASYGSHNSSPSSGLPETDLSGAVEFERLSPGYYVYFVQDKWKVVERQFRSPQEYARVAAFDIGPGETYEKTVQFGVPQEGSTAKLLYDWEKEYRKSTRERDLKPRKIQESVRRELAELVAARLEELPGRYWFEAREATRLAAAAEGYGLSETVPALQDMLARWLSAGEGVSHDRQLRVVVHAVVALAGDDAVPFFAAAATDARFLYEVRRESVVGLGQIGTEKSVAAFVKLRDAAFGKPGTPERKESYTHAEKMAETVEMVFNVIPRLPSDDAPPPLATVSPEDAWVSEGFTEGHIGCRMPGGGYTRIMMRRFGNEWLIAGFGQTVIS